MTSNPLKDEAKVQKAFAAYTANKFPSIAAATRHFCTKYDHIKDRVNRLPVQPRLLAYNLLLTPHEEKGRLIWLYCYDVLRTRATV